MAPGISAPWHMHPGAQEIMFVIDGNLVVEIDGAGSREVTSGAIALISAETPHLVRNDTPTGARALVTHSRADKEKSFAVVFEETRVRIEAPRRSRRVSSALANMRSKASSLVRSLEAERNRKCHACSDFLDGMAIGERVAIRDVDGKLVIDLADQPD
jgi:hypothetical protein